MVFCCVARGFQLAGRVPALRHRLLVRSAATRSPSEQFRSLADDAVRVAVETGPRAAVRRTVEGQRALLLTTLELARELPRPPSLQDIASMSRNEGGLAVGMVDWVSKNVPEEFVPKFLRILFERLGATYVKIGQFIASSPTLFPAAYVKEFERCLDSTPPIPYEQVAEIVEREVGMAKFDSFERAPLASASIAQVHAAVYKGKDVVVKVRKPGVDDLLKADLGFIEIAGKFLQAVAPELGRLSLADVVTDLRNTMLDELDFNKELENLQKYGDWLVAAGLDDVATCPTPYPEASGKSVLTMERLYGAPVTDLDAIRSATIKNDPESVLVNALNVWSASVLTCEFFHADVHAGNLLALSDGRVAFLDFGIVGRVPPKIWNEVFSAGDAALRRDYAVLAKSLRDMGASDTDVDLLKFARDLQNAFEALDSVQPTVVLSERPGEGGVVAAQLALDDTQVADVLVSLVDVTENNGIKLPREFGLLVKQALYFDRYTKLLAPDIDVTQDDRLPYLRDATDRTPKQLN